MLVTLYWIFHHIQFTNTMRYEGELRCSFLYLFFLNVLKKFMFKNTHWYLGPMRLIITPTMTIKYTEYLGTERRLSRSQRPSGRFLLRSRLLCGPDRWRISSWSDSNVSWQKQQLKCPESPLSPPPPTDITLRCTEQRCFNKCAFCLNMATQSLHAKGFSPVWTRRWVLRFQDIPNCLPQYSQRYSLVGALLLSSPSLPPPCGIGGGSSFLISGGGWAQEPRPHGSGYMSRGDIGLEDGLSSQCPRSTYEGENGTNGGFWAGALWKPGLLFRCGVTT